MLRYKRINLRFVLKNGFRTENKVNLEWNENCNVGSKLLFFIETHAPNDEKMEAEKEATMKQKWHRPNAKRYAHSRKLNFLYAAVFSASSLHLCVCVCVVVVVFVWFYTVLNLIFNYMLWRCVCHDVLFTCAHIPFERMCVRFMPFESFRIYFYIQRLYHWLAVQFQFGSLIFLRCGTKVE